MRECRLAHRNLWWWWWFNLPVWCSGWWRSAWLNFADFALLLRVVQLSTAPEAMRLHINNLHSSTLNALCSLGSARIFPSILISCKHVKPNPETKNYGGHSSVLSVLCVCIHTENEEEAAWIKCSWYLVLKKRSNRYVRETHSNRSCKYVSAVLEFQGQKWERWNRVGVIFPEGCVFIHEEWCCKNKS